MTIKDITVVASGAFTVVTDKTVEAKIDEDCIAQYWY